MKKIKTLLFIFSFALVFFLASCGSSSSNPTNPTQTTEVKTTTSEHNLTHVEEKLPTYFEEGHLEYWTCSHCDKIFKDASATETFENLDATKLPIDQSMDGLLRGLEFNDVEVTYDGQRHQLKYEGARPAGIKIVCSPTTRYIAPGTYKYTIEVTYNGKVGTKTANLIISKIKPKYLGETENTVYLSDPSTQPSFEFDQEDVEVINKPYYKETGTYKYTLTTKETNIMASCEPTEITYTVLESKLGFKFDSKTLVTDGVNPVSLELEPVEAGTVLDTTKYEVKYENNSSNVQGNYLAKAQIIDKATKEVVEEYRAILNVDYALNADFEEYANSMFLDYLDDDQIAINLLLTNYKSFGIEHGDSSWYTFDGFEDITEDALLHDQALIAQERETVEAYKNAKLSFNQLITLKRIDEYIKSYENLLADIDYNFIAVNYVDQYGGYVADFPTYVESYSLRTKEDVEDLIKMIESTEDAFPSYYDYIVAKRDKGYGFSEFTLRGFLTYIEGVISNFNSEDGYYLARVVQEKLNDAKVSLQLTDAEYNDYKTQLVNAVNNTLKDALTDLSTKVSTFIEENTYFDEEDFNTSYYGATAKGRLLYYAQLQNRLGIYDLPAKFYKEELDAYVKKYHDSFMSVAGVLTDYADKIQSGEETIYDFGDDVLKVFDLLFDFADTIVYELKSKPEIDVTWMDPTTTVNTTTVAYYMKSPLDSFTNEYIHMNGRAISESNYDTLTTMAHEGYPGHLYAFVNTKENSNLSNFVKTATFTGHGEGWAKYVEYKFHDYLAEKFADTEYAEDFEALRLYAQNWEPFIFALYSRIDFGINYEGWKVSNISTYLKQQGLNSSAASSVYNSLNESPGQYAPYGYGQIVFIELHEQAQELLGAAYDEKEFNQVLLRQGWCALEDLKAYVQQYLNEQAFLLRLEA